jgi:enediyne biosynthesis protein E4
MNTLRTIFYCFAVFVLQTGCNSKTENQQSSTPAVAVSQPHSTPLFTLLSPQQTGVTFVNTLTEGLNTNILMYEYFYNGGGVAAGDLNGDGLTDLYFSSNMSPNKCYVNKGNMKFEDVTSSSKITDRPGPWKTGVTFVDINGDKKLDIYLSYSGMVRDENRTNQLFINQGNDPNNIPTFVEEGKKYGLDLAGYSNQGYFFDYDRDNDLDVLILNHNPQSLPVLNEVSSAEMMKKDDALKGIRLLKNNNGKFVDVTRNAGINGSALTYGLGVGISDLNDDGWPDFYVSNDYAVPDYLYINDHSGKFVNQLQNAVGHTSQFSMGNDIADVNNDGRQDIITLDMLPEDNHRQKLLMAPDNFAKFDLNIRSGFYYQYMRNMLHLNNGNGTYSEVGQIAGVSNTDWSWSALLADYNNDGWKDLYVTNGYFRDYTNLDFIKYMDDYVKGKGRLTREDVLPLINQMPASNVVNYVFSNNGGYNFTNQTTNWGMSQPANSNGASYADLDNDGDLDVVVNNINQPAFIYRNDAEKTVKNNFLQVKLEGKGKNTFGIGARVTIIANGKRQNLEQFHSRGYLSSVSPVLHFGLGTEMRADSLIIRWQNGTGQVLQNIKANTMVTLYEKDAKPLKLRKQDEKSVFLSAPTPFKHDLHSTSVNDFKRQPLLIHQFSNNGLVMIKGDVNNDGLDDIYLDQGVGQSALLYVQDNNKNFKELPQAAFESDKNYANADAVFFDADRDGDNDLYVASGGYHSLDNGNELLDDRIYINDGRGNFSRNKSALPQLRTSKACVAAGDINGDGSIDLFVGGRVVPGRYPETPASYLLINDGKGNFSDQTSKLAPAISNVGMVTAAAWVDMDQDKIDDLVVVGEWMPIKVFSNRQSHLIDESVNYFDKEYKGWWNVISIADVNNDKRPDIIAGNHGLNSQVKVSDKEPGQIFFRDFDNNGSVDPFFCFYIQGKSYPYVTRDEALEQVGALRARFTSFKSYADVTIDQIFKQEDLDQADELQINHLSTTLFCSTNSGKYRVQDLPAEVQWSPVHTINVLDYDEDGISDLILCGNTSQTKIRLGKFDANYGLLLKGEGNGQFKYIDQRHSGLNIRGDVRSTLHINQRWFFGTSRDGIVTYTLSKKKEVL